MSGRVYSVVFTDVAVSAAQDLFEITPADDKPVELLGLFIDPVGGVADSGDASEEHLAVTVIRGYTASGTGGSAPTPIPMDGINTAAGFAAEVNNTTVANTGTAVTMHSGGFNSRVGFSHWWTPETVPKASQANTTIVVRLVNAPADATDLSGTLYVREL